ncbi:MAG: glycoside hydrolase family 2 protein [Candidatus Hodarchaeota archaeon]
MQPEWNAIEGNLLTRWSSEVDPRKPLPEYPRPQMVRERWLNLNGLWDYAIRSKDVESVEEYDGKILVPFCVESALSGVKKKLKPSQRIWYRRTFTLPEGWSEQNILLHFGAVDWEAIIWLNGKEIGNHEGGYVPFSFDITEAVNFSDDNEIVVSVWDPTDKGKQQFGKQTLHPSIVAYTAVSGIWQTAWIEPVSKRHVSSLKITPDLDNSRVVVKVNVKDTVDSDVVHIAMLEGNKEIKNIEGVPNENLVIDIKEPKPWLPESPNLYDLSIKLLNEGKEIDLVKSYFGMRKISVEKDDSGNPRIALNGKILFQHGSLDQGYWPDGLYTAPTDEALRFDIELAKKMGFNLIRKHGKVEPARWYYHCDKLGMLVWQDMPHFNNMLATVIQSVFFGKKVLGWGRKKKEEKDYFYAELEAMVKSLYNHPCIVTWTPFNEGWGQFDTGEVVKRIRNLDPSRLIDEASGWVNEGFGDLIDWHTYPSPRIPEADGSKPLVIGEFGGIGIKVKGHCWKFRTTIPFVWILVRNLKHVHDLYERYVEKLRGLIKEGLSAAVYTQIVDVEKEYNGLVTYDREINKIDIKELHSINSKLYSNKNF